MKIRKIDAAIIFFFILLAAIVLSFNRCSIDKNYSEKYVMIYSDNKLYKKVAINDEKLTDTIQIKSKYGNNTVEVTDGGALMKDTDCQDKICAQTGFIDQPGQSIVCLPHKLVIEIEGNQSEAKNSGIDVISH